MKMLGISAFSRNNVNVMCNNIICKRKMNNNGDELTEKSVGGIWGQEIAGCD